MIALTALIGIGITVALIVILIAFIISRRKKTVDVVDNVNGYEIKSSSDEELSNTDSDSDKDKELSIQSDFSSGSTNKEEKRTNYDDKKKIKDEISISTLIEKTRSLLSINNYHYINISGIPNIKNTNIWEEIMVIFNDTKAMSYIDYDDLIDANWIVDSEKNKVVGYVTWKSTQNEEVLECLGLGKNYKGKGLTKELLIPIIEYHLKDKKTTEFVINVLTANNDAKRAYEKSLGCKISDYNNHKTKYKCDTKNFPRR